MFFVLDVLPLLCIFFITFIPSCSFFVGVSSQHPLCVILSSLPRLCVVMVLMTTSAWLECESSSSRGGGGGHLRTGTAPVLGSLRRPGQAMQPATQQRQQRQGSFGTAAHFSASERHLRNAGEEGSRSIIVLTEDWQRMLWNIRSAASRMDGDFSMHPPPERTYSLWLDTWASSCS